MVRKKFPKVVEECRVVSDPEVGTSPGDPFGLFFVRNPRSGRQYKVMVGDGGGWDHVSVSTKQRRIPTWNEMCWIKNLFFDPTECVIQYHPAVEDYVDIHTGCLHLWRPQNEAIPMPPIEFV